MSATILDAFEYALTQGYTGTQAEFTELMSLALKYEKTTRKDLGRATAYGYAKSKGYTGTEEQFAELMASYATVAEEAADSASEAKGYAEDSQEWSVESEAWAVGQRNGASVDSEDPAYHNNSKYYKERAEELAEDAAISAATFTTDTSLTVAGKAADAKVTGNRLAGIAAAVGSPLVITDPDDFDNASHTRVYVYAGTTTSLYTNGDWYYWDGDGWENGGVYNSVAVDTDDTLSVSGMAADAAAVGEVADEVTDLKSALDSFTGETSSASPVTDWVQGDFSITTGAEIVSQTRIRTVSAGIPSNVTNVQAINGYKFLAYAWAGNTYLGIWTGSGFNKQSASGLVITELDVFDVYTAGATKVRLSLMRSTTSERTAPSECENLVYTYYENYIPFIKDDLKDVDEFVDEVKISYQSGNIYQARTDDVNNRYYYRNSSGVLSVGVNTDYIGFIVPVIPHRTYTFTRSNLLLLKSDKTLVVTTGGNYDVAGVRTCYSGEAHYFAVTVRRADIPESGYVMSMGDSLDDRTYSDSVYTNPVPPKRVLDSNSISGSLADGEEHVISGKFGPRDGYCVAFHGTFSSFSTVAFKFNGYNVTNAVSVNSTNLVIVSGIGNTITQAHGLTIADAIAVLLELENSVMYITVESGGTKYQYHCPWYWTGSSPSEIGVSASGMSFTNSKISLRVASASRSIWYFGDSYAEFNTDARFPYYMAEYGFDKNVMFNSISGSTSTTANDAFTALLAYGNPKYAVNALGMNDGSDVDTASPKATWLANIQTFISLCEQHDIIPVLCTIPTIPSVNNNGKNAWVKASGYRYIDMAGAVGADGTGTWYTGMLGDDNIHPSPLGAVAQFMQLLTDMPEVM